MIVAVEPAPGAPDDLAPPDPFGRIGRPRLRGWLHVVGVAGMVVAGPWLVASATTTRDRWGALVFVLGAIAMMGTSAAYHVVRWPPRWLGPMRRADHSTIFVAIAATYTPFLLAVLTGSMRTWVMLAVWVGAGVGIAVNQVAHHAPRWIRTVPALALGLASIVLVPAMWRTSPSMTLLVAAGGAAYVVGAVAYAMRRPDTSPAWFGHHEFFHAMTLVAIALHAWAVHIATTLA